MTTERAFQVPETVPMRAIIGVEGVPLHDPDESVQVNLIAPDGTLVFENQDALRLSLGNYVYYWNPPSDAPRGNYIYRYLAQDGAGAGAKKTVIFRTFQLQ